MSILGTIGGLIANIGASKVTTDVIKNIIHPENMSKLGKVMTAIGIIGISGLVGDAVQTHAEKQIEKGMEVLGTVAKIGQKTEEKIEEDSEEESDAE